MVTENFYQTVLVKDSRFNSPYRIADLNLLEPIFRSQILAIIHEAKSLGFQLMVFETFRSKERQEALYQAGATQLKTVGVHHFGIACDLVKSVDGKPSWEGDFTFLGKLSRTKKLIWGGDWGQPDVVNTFYDGAHLQRCAVFRQESLFNLNWYPDEYYDAINDQVDFVSLSTR